MFHSVSPSPPPPSLNQPSITRQTPQASPASSTAVKPSQVISENNKNQNNRSVLVPLGHKFSSGSDCHAVVPRRRLPFIAVVWCCWHWIPGVSLWSSRKRNWTSPIPGVMYKTGWQTNRKYWHQRRDLCLFLHTDLYLFPNYYSRSTVTPACFFRVCW